MSFAVMAGRVVVVSSGWRLNYLASHPLRDQELTTDYCRLIIPVGRTSVLRHLLSAGVCWILFHALAVAQSDNEDITKLQLLDWQPRSMLVTKVTRVNLPKYPAINIHCHLGQGRRTLTPDRVAGYLEEMNAAGVEKVINLDGGWGDGLRETLAALDKAHPGRFMTFARVNFTGIDDDGWSEREAASLEDGFKAGAKGLKISKRLGLMVRYADGRLMPVDDPKLDPIWEVCGKYDRPIVIHVADPAAFFTPLDRFNERWHQLNAHPDWLFGGEEYPSRAEILEQRNRVIARHPNTTFVCAHFGNNPENLASVGEQLDKHENMFVEISARINELGRQPYTARRFFIQHQDRILFGTDGRPDRVNLRIFYRFLESDDEYFESKPNQRQHRPWFWPIYGIFLPDDVLQKVYRTNAERVFARQG